MENAVVTSMSAAVAEVPQGDLSPRLMFLDHVGVLGGAELSLIDMARANPTRDHVILMQDGPLRAKLEAVGIGVSILPASPVFSKPRRRSGFLAAVWAVPYVIALARKIAQRLVDYDLVWANSQKSFVVGCLASAMAGRPLVWHLRDILSPEHFSWFNRKIAVTLANRFSARVITVSNAGLQGFVASGGRAELATVVYNGIASKEFDLVDRPLEIQSVRTEFRVGDAPVLGVFGRLTAWKGQDILIRALPALPGIHALIVGESLFGEQDYADSLRALVKELGLTDRVHFAGFRKDVAELMCAVDLVVHTSTAPEPFGRVIVEAMLARRPVIASDAGGAQEIITHGEDGILVPASRPDILANAIKELLDHPEKADTIASRGYETAVRRFGIEAFLQNIEVIKHQVHEQSLSPSAVTKLGTAPPKFAGGQLESLKQ